MSNFYLWKNKCRKITFSILAFLTLISLIAGVFAPARISFNQIVEIKIDQLLKIIFNNDDDEVNIAQAKEIVEITGKRTLTAKSFDNGDRTFTMHSHIGHIHYKDKEEKEFKDIDTKLLPTAKGWEMQKASYELEIPKYADDWFKFINSFILDPRTNEEHTLPGETVSMKPLGVGHIEGQLITDEKENWQNKKIVYPNAYGQDIDLVIQARNIAFDKLVVINKKPEDLSSDLEFKFEIDVDNKTVFKLKKELSAEVVEKVREELKNLKNENEKYIQTLAKFEDETQREIWDKKKVLETSDSIILGKLKKTWFRDFKVWDSEGNQGSCKVRLEEKNGKLFLTKILDKDFLEKAVYPVFTDDSASYYSGAADGYVSNDDNTWAGARGGATGYGWNSTNLYFSSAHFALWIGEGEMADIARSFFYFDTSGLPDDCTIDAAVLKIYGYGYAESSVSAQKGTQADTLTTADYDSFTGSEYGHVTWGIGAYNSIIFNAQGETDIDKTGTTKICTREYAHDYLNVMPGDDGFFNGCYYAEETGTDKDPYLEVTYTTALSNTAPNATSVSDAPDPVNVGSDVTFTGGWTESDSGDLVKMYVCKDSSCTNCNSTTATNCWCSSGAYITEPTVTDTCTYTAQSGDIGANSYWLGVCDDGNACDATPLSGGTFTAQAAPLSTAIEIRAQDYSTAVTDITFPEGDPSTVVSLPTNGVGVEAQAFGVSKKPVVTLVNTAAVAYNIWYNITAFSNGVVSSENYVIIAKGGACANADAINQSATLDGSDHVTTGAVTTIAATGDGGDADERDLYLKVTLSAVAGKTGTSTLTVLGET